MRKSEEYVDLHLHLDGSLSPEFILERAEREGIDLGVKSAADLCPLLTANQETASLNEYLQCFEIPLQVLQSAEGLEGAAYDLVRRLSALNITYSEIRYAPGLHTRAGLSQEEAVETVNAGLQKGVKDFGVKSYAILCCMRGGEAWQNMETIELAGKYLGKGVAGADLAGAEALYGTELYQDVFTRARELGVPFTIHAGEAAGPESIRKALALGASRIGHGIAAVLDEDLMEELARREIPLEMCPLSNLQTKAVKDIKEYPLRTFLEKGIIVTVNSDNMTVSGTDVVNEFCFLEEQYGLTKKEKEILMKNGRRAAYMTD
ncbi:adenosine deaminase [Lachnospiraceae bacterium PF1-21]|uniref:adenosine deaminase n=1 Tax=Ohessyouella blattaphilus TaxID=2949333 RepID=UPI003E2AB9AD